MSASITSDTTPDLVHVTEGQTCSDDAWEEAYRRFETPEEEIAKFLTRLRWFGVEQGSRDQQIVELFCGRGNALIAWNQLGFRSLEGVDLSATLISEYQGPARCYVADARELPFEDESRDLLAVHGGLHHLPELKEDLAKALDEVVRVLRPGGRFLVVEPWNTPFLRMVHAAAANPLLQKAFDKFEAFHQLYVHEQETYDRWRNHPELIIDMLEQRFTTEKRSERWGKLYFLGRKES